MPAEHSLSRLELVVLARMAVKKPPAASALAKSLQRIAFPDGKTASAKAFLERLIARQLLDKKRTLTPTGDHALRTAFGRTTTPTWEVTRRDLLPQLIADALGHSPDHTPAQKPPPPPPPRDLLAVVREAMLRVPSAGRFGEKVFVSALWQDLQVADLPLDKFKHWLVGANRDGQIVLARADLPSAMNPKLVAASEIRDQGATFHFVLDAQPTNGRTTHAR